MFRSNPIQSALDTDFYKFSIQQAYFHQFDSASARWELICRSDHQLGLLKNELIDAISGLGRLTFKPEDVDFLKGLGGYFQNDYLHYLRQYRFDTSRIELDTFRDNLVLSVTGPLVDVSLFEVPLLALICEVANAHSYADVDEAKVLSAIDAKIETLLSLSQDNSLEDFRFADFGTRRRFSYYTQDRVIGRMQKRLPHYFVGTSNVHLARQYNVKPIGTMAHEWIQALQALEKPLRDSQRKALYRWSQEYGGRLGVALTDTIGVDAFCDDMDEFLATNYWGFRHDSGSPFSFGEKIINKLHTLNIDPRTKTLVFSDNLDFEKAVKIYQFFHKKINMCFGIGTWLTGDVGVNKPLNIVMKLLNVNGSPVAKISDSPGKTTGNDRAFVSRLKKIFNREHA